MRKRQESNLFYSIVLTTTSEETQGFFRLEQVLTLQVAT